MRYLSARSPLIERAMGGKRNDVIIESDLLRLIAWVDAHCPYVGEKELSPIDNRG
jgi:hypothetical protein